MYISNYSGETRTGCFGQHVRRMQQLEAVKGKAERSELTFWRASSSYGSRWWAREEELVHVQQRGGRARGLYNETKGNEAELSLVWPVLFGRRLVDKWCSYKKHEGELRDIIVYLLPAVLASAGCLVLNGTFV
jgi:hypothetical protein